MYLSSLHLRDFRNFAEQRLDLPAAGVALVGDNGQGKTNLLEAIYYLQIFRSFRGAPDEQLVRFGADVFRVAGRVEGGPGGGEGAVEIAAAFDRRGRKKRVTVGGAEPERIGEAIGRVGAVIFSPSDVQVVAGGPGGRRRFLDILLSLTAPGYLTALQRYRHVLLQRNALLRQGSSPGLVAAWNDGLVHWGSRVVEVRARWVTEHAPSFARRFLHIAGHASATLGYEASVPFPTHPPTAVAVEEAFHGELERVAEREARRGMTVVGPHRDDLALRMAAVGNTADTDLRLYGSGGQQRTAAVALRMVEAESLQAANGYDPIVLLDDVFAELDPGRAARILEWVETEESGQVILTAPKPGDFEVRGGSLARWTIRDGEVHPF